MTCTTPDCGNPSDLYLCRDCVRDLQAWIDKARELLPDLEVTILRLDNVRRRSEGGNGGKSGSADKGGHGSDDDHDDDHGSGGHGSDD